MGAEEVSRSTRRRHKRSRDPRRHWLLLLITLSLAFGAMVFNGWTTQEVDGAKGRQPCTQPVPKGVGDGGPVLRFNGDRVTSTRMPARTVALTFDGGPEPVWTPRLLDLLHKHHAHATFFLVGAKAAQYPDLVQRIRAEGHEIGSLTYTGGDLGTASPLRRRMELSLTQTVLAGSAGVHTTLLRMPLTTSVDTLCGAEWDAAQQS